MKQIELVAAARPYGIVLREKDLSEEDYLALAEKTYDICERYGVRFIAHTFVSAARGTVHMPIDKAGSVRCAAIGASCHSLADVKRAEELGCEYATFGHVFSTECKRGLPPRGLAELGAVCRSVGIPVYAIGGIDERNARSVIESGASGVCIMSGAMNENAAELIKKLRQI